MTFGLIRKGAGFMAVSFITAAAVAQAAGSEGAGQPAAQPTGPALNLPQDVNFVGARAEPNVVRATAIVNEEIITRTDVEQRLALLMSGQQASVPPEQLERDRAQVLRLLIDEALQIQAARERELTVDQAIINREYARIAQRNGQTPEAFAAFLSGIGSSERSLKRQILAQASWQRVQQRIPQVSVGNAEVEARVARMLEMRGSSEYRVAEIYMEATPENAQQIRARMNELIAQIRAGAPFPTLARLHSTASTSANGGDLGWVRPEQLPPELAAVVQQMPVGAISDPIQVSGGFSVVALVDSRQVLTANPRDAQLSLLQMSIELPAGTTEAVARQRAEQLAAATRTMGGCGGAPQAATSVGAELVGNDVVVRDLPPQLQSVLLGMSVGQATSPFGSNQRVSVLVLCGRDDPETAATPSASSVAEAIEEERMNRQAQRLLRDLRRDAVIEYR